MSVAKYSEGAIVVAIGLAVAGLAEQKFQQEYDASLSGYRAAAAQELQRESIAARNAFQHIYENLRTIAGLPSVRKIDRHGTNIDADARMSIQQIYNNLASSVDVSEVYIVPGDLNPGSIDQTTGKPEEPILMFDELITGRESHNDGGAPDVVPGNLGMTPISLDGDEEYEYRQLVDHMRYFKANFPTNQDLTGLDVPVISGPEIITCDNTQYRWTRNDHDRDGIMFSVPFYGEDGALKGTITAIMRSNAIRALIPARDFALINVVHHFVAPSLGTGQQSASMNWVRRAEADPSLLYSGVASVNFNDMTGKWVLWSGHPDRAFLDSSEVGQNHTYRVLTLVGCLIATIGALAALILFRRKAEESQWRDLSNATVEGLIVCDASKLVDTNRSFTLLVGRPAAELINTPVSKLFQDPKVLDRLSSELDAPIETELTCGNDESIPVELIARIISYRGRKHRALAVRDLRERKKADDKLKFMARHDPLTKLANRNWFSEEMEIALRRIDRGQPVAVLCLDLDQFKQVNDTLGHSVGDTLLRAVAERIKSNVRREDVVARMGGDEFAVLQVGAEQPDGSHILAQRLIEKISEPYEVDGHHVVVGTSIGVAIAPEDGRHARELLKRADLALYRAKADGRGISSRFEPAMGEKAQARRMLEMELRKAVKLEEFELFYQPQVDTKTRALRSFEALLRWRHPERGLVPPLDFIPLAEETGLMGTIGAWVLKKACADAMAWPDSVGVAVNVSAAQFRNRSLEQDVQLALDSSGLSPRRLELEITESILLENTEKVIEAMSRLRASGISIAMDDFGTGYSSLSYLSRFPIDKIKIDRSFVKGTADDDSSLAVIRAVVGLTGSLGMISTAEGVETLDQLTLLETEGCTEIQGYYFSKPIPAVDIPKLMETLRAKFRLAA